MQGQRRIGFIIGTRPEAIKLIPVIRALKAHPAAVVCEIVLSGQQRAIVAPLLQEHGIPIDHETGMVPGPRTLTTASSELLKHFEPLFANNPWSTLVVQGDTTSAFIGALAGFYHQIPVAHVEAGLRSHSLAAPFPEELNRTLISRIARWHYAPTPGAAQNLRAEGISASQILVTGNTVVDALKFELARQKSASAETAPWAKRFGIAPDKKFVFVTAHRRESFGAPLVAMYQAIAKLAARKDVGIVVATHTNPQAAEPAHRILRDFPNVLLMPPLSYAETVYCLSKATLLITDSGGLQEEAPTFGLPTLITRDTTERPEALAPGRVELVGCDTDKIVSRAMSLLYTPPPRQCTNPFGDGTAGETIAQHLLSTLSP